MSTDSQTVHRYARDDFRYPHWLTRILNWLVSRASERIKSAGLNEKQFRSVLWGLAGLYVIVALLGNYLLAGLLMGLWVFADQIYLRLFISEKAPNRYLAHVIMEAPFVLALALHFFTKGYIFTGIATVLGLAGMYLLSGMQMKYDLASIHIPKLYFLRRDRLGMLAIMVLLGAWTRPRAYLWPILGGWFLLALTFYDYIWVIIQFMKSGKK